MTIFDKIISGEIPADLVHDDELCLAFHDQNPQSPVHVLIIPKKQIPMLQDIEQDDQSLLGHLMLVAKKIALELKLDTGFRVVINNGPDACQSVYHLHLHLMGGRGFSWPPG